MKYFALLILFGGLFSCTSYQTVTIPISQKMNTWLNLPENYIIRKWGPPTRTYPDGSDGKIISYESSQLISTSMVNSMYGATSMYGYYNGSAMSRAAIATTYVQFYINSDGKVYSWRTNLPDIKEKVKVN